MAAQSQDLIGLLRDATAARQKGDRAGERRLIEAALAYDPAHPQALNMMGMALLGEGRAAEAAVYFERAAAGDPQEPALWMNAATAYRTLRDDSRELASLDRALALDKIHFMALLRKAELHERRGENALALRNWQAVLGLAEGMGALPPALRDRLGEAREVVDRESKLFAQAVDQGLYAELDALPPPDGRRMSACIDVALGRRRVYSNECAGLHVPFLPADEYFDRHHFPWLASLEARTGAIRSELEGLLAASVGARPYVDAQPGVAPNKWSGLAGSLEWTAMFLWEYGARNETVCALCPETVAALMAVPQTELPRRAPTAFFSILRPHAHIPAHTGVTNSRTIIHLPLIVPPGCSLRVGGETREWRVGEAMAFDDTIQHEAWNRSDELRAVLIFDVWNPHLTLAERATIKRFFDVADASGHGPDSPTGF